LASNAISKKKRSTLAESKNIKGRDRRKEAYVYVCVREEGETWNNERK